MYRMRLYIRFSVMEMHQGRVQVLHKDQTVLATGALQTYDSQVGWGRALEPGLKGDKKSSFKTMQYKMYIVMNN